MYHLWDVEQQTLMVAKISMRIKDNLDRKSCFQDVKAQEISKMYAQKFNSCNPPKLVDLVSSFVLELSDRPGKPL